MLKKARKRKENNIFANVPKIMDILLPDIMYI